MPVRRRRTRLITFRVSDEEFESIQASPALQRARSLSDLARLSLLQVVNGKGVKESADQWCRDTNLRIQQIERRVTELQMIVAKVLEQTASGPLETAGRNTCCPPTPPGDWAS